MFDNRLIGSDHLFNVILRSDHSMSRTELTRKIIDTWSKSKHVLQKRPKCSKKKVTMELNTLGSAISATRGSLNKSLLMS